ncbi:MAG: biotin/lipoyl-binding protein [Candidatus Paceibacterota bacterium]
MKINKKFLIILALLLGSAVWAYLSLKPKTPTYKTVKVERGAITQEVAETGTVKKGEAVNLNFRSAGTIDKINVVKGQEVAVGDVLAELDSRQLRVQLQQARANLNLYELQLSKLEKGATGEDVSVIKSQVAAAQSGLDGARQSLADAREGAKQKIDSAYKSASDSLSAAYAKAYNGYNFADLLQRTYFVPRDSDSIAVWEAAQKIGAIVGQIKTNTDAAVANGKDAGLDPVFTVSKKLLADVESGLRNIRAICEKTPWRDSVAQTYKDNLDLHIGYMVAAQASFNSAIETIALQKSANDLAVNSAQSGVDAAQAALKTANGQLAKAVAAPREEDVGVLESQVAQARAQVDLLELQIGDSSLVSPIAGQVIEVNGKAGETVTSMVAAGLAVILPADPYSVEVDIYEEEAIKVKVGDPAEISIAAIPDKAFNAAVVSMDPAGKFINGVVYYATKIGFKEMPQGLKPEMTADVVIKTASKENVLQVPENTVQKRQAGGYYVQILEGDQAREAGVETGIRSKGMVEIISGISESNEIIIP